MTTNRIFVYNGVAYFFKEILLIIKDGEQCEHEAVFYPQLYLEATKQSDDELLAVISEAYECADTRLCQCDHCHIYAPHENATWAHECHKRSISCDCNVILCETCGDLADSGKIKGIWVAS